MTPTEQYNLIQQHHEIYQDLVQQGYLEPVEAYTLVQQLAKGAAASNGVPAYWMEYMPCQFKENKDD